MISDVPPFIKGVIGGRTVTQEFDDAYSDITVIERQFMAPVATMNVAKRYWSDAGDELWIVNEVGYNALGEVIYVKRLPHLDAPPTFALALSGVLDT